ncbi:hypothetical protein HID58_010308 [Brassica napus]|uniref:Uncharacterized protein n=1 Tax=Brassica napus TaxID=3708 RepID=A0ABQ8DV26_BRANA|nr:hypothetical protein HID58_010308 [Brassica napus]
MASSHLAIMCLIMIALWETQMV